MSWSYLENGERNIAAALMTVLLFLPGCNEFGWNPLDPNYKPPVESAKEEAIVEAVKPSQLSYSLSVFEGGSSIYDEYIDIEDIMDFFTNRGRPRVIEYKVYLANLERQLAIIEEEERRKL